MVRHTTSTGASIRTSRSITRSAIGIRSLAERGSAAIAGRWITTLRRISVTARSHPRTATNGSTSSRNLQPMIAGCPPDLVLVLASTDEGPSLFAVDRAADGLTRISLPVLDRTRRMSRLELAAVPGRLVGAVGGAEPVVARTLLTASVALGAEQVGGTRPCLGMAVDYAKIRVQFNRRIGGLHAVKHIFAAMYNPMETARSAGQYAAW